MTLPFLTISTWWPSVTQSKTLPKSWRSCLTLAVFMFNKDVIHCSARPVNAPAGARCAFVSQDFLLLWRAFA